MLGLGWLMRLVLSASLSPSAAGPSTVVNGQDASECEWPSTVALEKFGSVYCTGTLIHPRVIMTAAHCLHPDGGWGVPDSVNFGEDGFNPTGSVVIETCGIHPLYVSDAPLHSRDDAYDLGYCRLAEPVDVPTTPMIMGCEVEQLQPDREVFVVGFGASAFPLDTPEGIGLKRWSAQTLEAIDDQDQVFVLGGEGSSCSGDSGGSAYVQLQDGSWRVIGATARVHPDAPEDPPYCLYGTVYTGAWNEMLWYEQETDFDLTPCHDPSGAFEPSAECGQYPLDPLAEASWDDACGAQPRGTEYAECPDPPSGDSGGTETTAGVDDTTGGDSETTGAPAADSEGTSSGDGSMDPGSTSSSAASSDGTGSGQPALDDEGGCACGTTNRKPSVWWMFALVVAIRRRRQAEK